MNKDKVDASGVKKVVLVVTPSRTRSLNYIVPTGILSLAAYLLECGHEVSVIDAAKLRESNEQIIERIKCEAPDLIGIGGIITAYKYIFGLTEALKKEIPEIPIVLGGQVVINNENNCFKYMPIDYIIHGYGEIALEKLVRHLQGKLNLEEIPGIAYRIGNEYKSNPGREFFKKMDDMPFPAYHLIDMEHYATVNGTNLSKFSKYLRKTGKGVKNHRFMTVMGNLGCTDRCTFCVHEQEYVGLKLFSSEYLIRHMEYLHNKYDINIFAIGEEMFLTTVKRAREFNRLMRERLPNIYWQASTRGDFVTPELIEELEKGNCFAVVWGYESGSQKMLDLMKKRMTVEKNNNAYMAVEKSSLVVSCSLMVGNVGEDNDTIKETIVSIRKAHIGSPSAFIAQAYPGGRTYDWAIEQGIITDTHKYLLKASDKDAATTINKNMTPYPDWVLWLWRQRLIWECYKQEKKKANSLHDAQPIRAQIREFIRVFLGAYAIPAPLHWSILELYFICRKLRKLMYKTKKDTQYEYMVDEKKAVTLNNLIVEKPQKYMTPEKIEILFSDKIETHDLK